jgi:hypothetical protein
MKPFLAQEGNRTQQDSANQERHNGTCGSFLSPNQVVLRFLVGHLLARL